MYEYRVLSSRHDYMPGALGKKFELAFIAYDESIYFVAWERAGDRLLVSDEGYWRPESPVGEELQSLIDAARYHGWQAGVNITPWALKSYAGEATPEQLIDSAERADWVSISPYHFGGDSAIGLLAFSAAAVDIVHAMGKPIYLIMQGFAIPGTEEQVQEYNAQLAQLPFDEIVVGDAYDWLDIPDDWQIDALAQLVGVPDASVGV